MSNQLKNIQLILIWASSAKINKHFRAQAESNLISL